MMNAILAKTQQKKHVELLRLREISRRITTSELPYSDLLGLLGAESVL
jgi:hypothetical protein